MEIGINDIDFDNFEQNDEQNTTTQDTLKASDDTQEQDNAQGPELSDKEIISEFLKSKGISDISKIKYEDNDGEEEEVDWDSLDSNEKLSILHNLETNNSSLDLSEQQLISDIRNSRMSPQEYLNYVANQGANYYAQNLQAQSEPVYNIDQFSDEDVFATDLISRMGRNNITDDEVQEALDKAKSNETLFKKQVEAIRNEYKKVEDENAQYAQYMQQQEQQEQFNQFANAIRDQVANFNEFNGFDLNMDNEDKEELYDFIVGQDEAGVSILGKAMNDPAILTRMAWFALHGEQMLDDISDYIRHSVTQVRRDSYNKGVADARAGKVKEINKKPVTVYKQNKKQNRLSIDDLD